MSFKDSRYGKASSSVSRRPLFSGGSSADWFMARPKVHNAFKINKCFDLIQPHPPVVVAQAPGYAGPVVYVAAAIVEDLFIEVKPDVTPHAVDLIIQNSIDARTVLHNNEIARLTALMPPVLSANDQAYKISTQAHHLASDLLKIEKNRPIVETRLLTALQRYETIKGLFEVKTAACLETFSVCFGDEVLAVITQELSDCHFRKAINKIDTAYGVNPKDGQANMSILLNVLGSIVFMPEKKSLAEHIVDIKSLAAQVTQFGGGGTMQINDALILTYLCDSVKKSSHKDYKEDVKWIENGSENLEEAERRFHRTSQRLKMEATKAVHLAGPRTEKAHLTLTNKDKKRLRDEYLTELKESASVVVTSNKKVKNERKFCSKCKRMGYHTPEQCWVGQYTCAKCGQSHPTEKCHGVPVSGEKSEAQVKKVSLVKMYKK